MRRINLIMTILVALMMTLLISAHSQAPSASMRTPQVASRMTNEQRLKRGITTQQRLNRYFHNNVIPKLRNCWSSIQGRGNIEIEHNYTRDASDNWVAGKLTVGNSTLPRGQEAVALQCMQDVVRATAFPAEASDGDSKQYAVKWTWPVPFPLNADARARAMFIAKDNGVGTGCDGEGTPAKCFNCKFTKTGFTCNKVCVGYKECSITFKQNVQSCGETGACASGGPFGVAGRGVIIF